MGKPLSPPLTAAFLFLAIILPASAVLAQAGTPAYMALGDSLAFGVGADNPAAQGYPALAASALRESDRYGESGLEFVNLSVPGATSADLLAEGGQLGRALAEIEARAGSVEIITVNIGGNDLLSLAALDSPCLQDTLGQECVDRLITVLADMQQNLRATILSLREAAPEAQIYVLDLYNPYSGTGDLREAVADIGVQQFNAAITAVAADPALGIELASVYRLFQGRAPQLISADQIHPNATGYQVMTEALLATIEGRPVSLPDGLLEPPVQAPQPDANDAGGGISTLALVISVALAFAAGAAVSSVYFLARGRE